MKKYDVFEKKNRKKFLKDLESCSSEMLIHKILLLLQYNDLSEKKIKIVNDNINYLIWMIELAKEDNDFSEIYDLIENIKKGNK